MSREYDALLALRRPPTKPRPGDMWLCRRLGIVRVVNGHRRGSSNRHGLNTFHLYHFHKPELMSRPCDWRDNDANSGKAFDPANAWGEKWEYVGNMFDALPYERLANMRRPT